MFAHVFKGGVSSASVKPETPVPVKSTDFSGLLGTQAQHGLVMKKETQPTVQTTATPAKKNEKPTSGWAGDLGLRSLNK